MQKRKHRRRKSHHFFLLGGNLCSGCVWMNREWVFCFCGSKAETVWFGRLQYVIVCMMCILADDCWWWCNRLLWIGTEGTCKSNYVFCIFIHFFLREHSKSLAFEWIGWLFLDVLRASYSLLANKVTFLYHLVNYYHWMEQHAAHIYISSVYHNGGLCEFIPYYLIFFEHCLDNFFFYILLVDIFVRRRIALD